MQDFQKMLESFIGGEFNPTKLLAKQKNSPQMGSLLPSETALGEVGKGASHAMASMMGGASDQSAQIASAGDLAPQGGGAGGAGMGALMGAMKGVQEAVKPNPWITPPPSSSNGIRETTIANVMQQPPPMQISGIQNDWTPYGDEEIDFYQQQNNMRGGFAYGGLIPFGGMGQVGNEKVYVDEEGAHVISNPETAPEDAAVEYANNPQYMPLNVSDQPMTGAESSRMQPPMGSLLSLPDSDAPSQQTDGAQAMVDAYLAQPSTSEQPNLGGLVGGQPDELGGLYDQYQKIQEEKGSPWRDAGYGALQGVANWLNKTNNPIQSYSDMRKAQKSKPILSKIGMIEGRQNRDLQQRKIESDIQRQQGLGVKSITDAQNAVYDDIAENGYDADDPDPIIVQRMMRAGIDPQSVKTVKPTIKGRTFMVGREEFRENPRTGEISRTNRPTEPTKPYTINDGTKDIGTVDFTEKEYADFLVKAAEWGWKVKAEDAKTNTKNAFENDADYQKWTLTNDTLTGKLGKLREGNATASTQRAKLVVRNRELSDWIQKDTEIQKVNRQSDEDIAKNPNQINARKELEENQKKIDAYDKEMRDNEKDIGVTQSELEAHKKNQPVKRPTVTSSSPAGMIKGKPVSKSKDPLGLFQ